MATTETDKNRFIAEKLEPEPGLEPTLWQPVIVDDGYKWDPLKVTVKEYAPLKFDTDPAAMVALIEAMREHEDGMKFIMELHGSGIGDSVDILSDVMMRFSPLVIRDAAYKALGGE